MSRNSRMSRLVYSLVVLAGMDFSIVVSASLDSSLSVSALANAGLEIHLSNLISTLQESKKSRMSSFVSSLVVPAGMDSLLDISACLDSLLSVVALANAGLEIRRLKPISTLQERKTSARKEVSNSSVG